MATARDKTDPDTLTASQLRAWINQQPPGAAAQKRHQRPLRPSFPCHEPLPRWQTKRSTPHLAQNEKGADPNVRTIDGWTLIHCAESPEVLDVLLTHPRLDE